jgi:hypothetical protein
MLSEQTRNVSIVVGGSIAMSLVLAAGFFLLCALSWGLMTGMNYGMGMLGMPAPFGGENGPGGLEILIGAFLLLSLRRLTRITPPEQ